MKRDHIIFLVSGLMAIASWTYLASSMQWAIYVLGLVAALCLIGMVAFMHMARSSLDGWSNTLDRWAEDQRAVHRYMQARNN